MALVKFTNILKRFYPNLKSIQVPGKSVSEILNALENEYPGIKDYLVDDQGKLRQHVNIFIGEDLIQDKEALQDQVGEKDELYIGQAISGG
ncbi:MAG: MoaD/ThiS family protein [Microscillaceae bacterium]|nr:MoaD/ThiS family protein [Microscillaceae bacterium]